MILPFFIYNVKKNVCCEKGGGAEKYLTIHTAALVKMNSFIGIDPWGVGQINYL